MNPITNRLVLPFEVDPESEVVELVPYYDLRDEFEIGDAELAITTTHDRAHVAVEVSKVELQAAN